MRKLESHIHLTLYPKYVELVPLVSDSHPPLQKIQDEGSFQQYKGRAYSRVTDNLISVICKNAESESIPDIGAKPTHLPFFSTGLGKESVPEW